MGNQEGKPVKDTKLFKNLLSCQGYFQNQVWTKINRSTYNKFSIIDKSDSDRIKYTNLLSTMFKSGKLNPALLDLGLKTNRGIACLLGLAVCDALGACTQFMHFVKDRRDLIAHDFKDVENQIKIGMLQSRHGKITVWTDDCSMALCIADSLILNKYQFNPKHTRYMFHTWLYHGLNNGGRPRSIGLGGNIKISMDEFCQNMGDYTAEKDRYNNGNGSLMRLAPVPMCFVNSPELAISFAQKQSRTTHNGDEAKQCSKLLSLILVRLMNRSVEQEDKWKQVIQSACEDFVNGMQTLPSVQCLALSKQQSEEMFNSQLENYKQKFSKFNKSVAQDRNWNWKDPNFTYSKQRVKRQPDYIGSYCMDALSMALHTVWFSKSFKEVALWNANMGGDCDTVGAIAGQIAGTIYGIDQYMLHLYGQMDDAISERYEVFLKAYKLMTHRDI